ncbi:ATP-binding protein [Fundidesulfovibrio agrisoli]|uniref:ATP-binding protein n=1 Tax=Fundidesulfovibrio agrisoli TaxID=2922717 RepID=UPI001FAB947B|nr:ATP-binding protein [Fundidesulfovibrio agrisoli]
MTLAERWKEWRFSVRYRLLLIVIASVLPMTLAACLVAYTNFGRRQADIASSMLASTRSYSKIIDQELRDIQADLEILAKSPQLASGDFSILRDRTLMALANRPESDIILADETGQQVFNSYLPPEAPLPKRNVPDRVRRVFETGEKSVSGVYRGAVTGRYMISIDVPVMRAGRVVFDLAMTIPVDHLIDALMLPPLPKEWTATILDSQGAIVMRTGDQNRLQGQKFDMPVTEHRMRDSAEGVLEDAGSTGEPSLVGYSHSKSSGWTVFISVPKALVERDLWQWLYLSVGGTLFLGNLGLALALSLGDSLSTSLDELASATLKLGQGNPQKISGMDLKETRIIASSITMAGDLLMKRDAELRNSIVLADKRAQLLDTTLESIAEGLFVLGADGTIQRLNQQAMRMFPFLAEGERVETNDGHPPLDVLRDGVPLLLDEIPAFRALRGEIVTGEELFFSDGAEIRFWGSVNAAPIYGPEGSIAGAVVTVQDITKRKTDEAFRADVERIVRHDIKSPLFSLHAMAELAFKRGVGNQFDDHVPHILHQIRNVTLMVDSVDKLLQMEGGAYEVQKTACSCARLFDSVRMTNDSLLEQSGVTLLMSPDEHHHILEGEEVLLEEMIQNLVKNAIEASPKGGVVEVTHKHERLGDKIEFHNEGAIPLCVRSNFFEKYVTSGKAYGTGLGTYSARLIAKAHGGDITFATSDREGTTITVTLPCGRDSSVCCAPAAVPPQC